MEISFHSGLYLSTCTFFEIRESLKDFQRSLSVFNYFSLLCPYIAIVHATELVMQQSRA